MAFDHSRCSDCSYGYSITCDCTNHMVTLQKQGQEANDRSVHVTHTNPFVIFDANIHTYIHTPHVLYSRLRELVVMREKMVDVSTQFIGKYLLSYIHTYMYIHACIHIYTHIHT